jgi:hypothetical protein
MTEEVTKIINGNICASKQVLNRFRTNFFLGGGHILGKIHVEAAFLMSFHPTKGLACMEIQHT